MNNDIYTEAEDYYDMARSWIDNGERDKAAECLRHVISRNPNFIYAYVDLAEILAGEKNYHDAQKAIKGAIHRDKNFHDLHYLMAKYAFKEHDYKKALKFIDNAICISPEYLYLRVRNVIQRRYESIN